MGKAENSQETMNIVASSKEVYWTEKDSTQITNFNIPTKALGPKTKKAEKGYKKQKRPNTRANGKMTKKMVRAPLSSISAPNTKSKGSNNKNSSRGSTKTILNINTKRLEWQFKWLCNSFRIDKSGKLLFKAYLNTKAISCWHSNIKIILCGKSRAFLLSTKISSKHLSSNNSWKPVLFKNILGSL